MSNIQKSVLITGCSTGIGRALALEFHERGFYVYATARKPATLSALADKGMDILKLDVNEKDDIKNAVAHIEAKGAGLDMLVNNAGFIGMGPLSEISLDRLRLQFETNVISVIALTQAFVPMMAKRKTGCIVNIGSVSGILSTPFAGAYCATKAAIHAVSDTLRMELSPFGIRVITVQPGGIESNLGNNAAQGIPLCEPGKSLYEPVYDQIERRALASQKNATPVDEFARDVVNALLSKKTKPLIRLGRQSSLLPFLRYGLPVWLRDRILMRKFGLNLLTKLINN